MEFFFEEMLHAFMHIKIPSTIEQRFDECMRMYITFTVVGAIVLTI